MSPKSIILTTTIIGSYIGGYIPAIWDAGTFSFSSIIFTAIGGTIGIWVGYKITR